LVWLKFSLPMNNDRLVPFFVAKYPGPLIYKDELAWAKRYDLSLNITGGQG
jgi:hypothetical protein